MITGSNRFRLGINYWPSELAMDRWQHFDEQPVKRDFARMGGSPKNWFMDEYVKRAQARLARAAAQALHGKFDGGPKARPA